MERSDNSEVDDSHNSASHADNTDHIDNTSNDMKALWCIKAIADKIRSKPQTLTLNLPARLFVNSAAGVLFRNMPMMFTITGLMADFADLSTMMIPFLSRKSIKS